jgi:hypothetical protein
MTTKSMAAAAIAALLFLSPGRAQSTADRLQKGIHAPETLGDVDGAIQIFRQVAASAGNKLLAAQTQYQRVVCILQKGDRSAAAQDSNCLRETSLKASGGPWPRST